MAITIRDVARKLGLSIAAVSRALDGYPDIAEDTRQRVKQTAKEMGYIPNRAARQLRRQRADAIGYILPADTPRFAGPFTSEFLAGLGDESACHPFDLMISIAPPGDDAEQRIYTNWVASRKVDGFILNHMRIKDWRVQYLSQQNIPFTALEHTQDGIDFPRVETDNRGAMTSLVAYLAGLGYQRIAFIGGPENLMIHVERLSGYRQGLVNANLHYNPEQVLSADLTSDGGYQAAKRLRWDAEAPDAITCINDETSFGVLHVVHDMGLTPGIDIAVTGFDGVLASQHTDPPLTTLDIPVYEIARKLVRMLADEMKGEYLADRKIIIQPKLQARGSTGTRHTG